MKQKLVLKMSRRELSLDERGEIINLKIKQQKSYTEIAKTS